MGSSGGQVNIAPDLKDSILHTLTYNLWIRLGTISFCRDCHDIFENYKEQQCRSLTIYNLIFLMFLLKVYTI